jgi:hypothetical protein
MRRLFLRGPLAGLLALVFLLQASGAGAVIEWCRSDPVVEIGGEQMYVYLSGPVDLLDAATGPTVVEIQVPPGVPVTLVSTDQGFGYGWDVRFAESADLNVTGRGTKVRVGAYVPADTAVPVLVNMQVTDGSGAVLFEFLGTTNRQLTVTVRL